MEAVKLLRLTMKAIAKKPNAYNQGRAHGYDGKPDCGSPACICGWLHYFRSIKARKLARRFVVYGPETVGMDRAQWNRLFYVSLWPRKFYHDGTPTAKTAIARIRHFIKTDGQK